MDHLTIGHVSAIIAAVIAILQFLLPNTLVLVLVSILTDTHSAVTWSVVGRSLTNSLWPLFLSSDTAASKNVSTKVKIVTWLRPLGLTLIAIAAVVTPIGLYDTISLARKPQMISFAYIQDNGPMGYGTPPRSDLGFSRTCGFLLPVQCPDTTVQIIYSSDNEWNNASIPGDDYDKKLPKALAQLYQSGISQQSRSVSSFFDIQARQYSYRTLGNIGNTTYLVNSYRPLTSLILDDTIEPVDGLIVNTQVGGVGLRNHSAPLSVTTTAEWDEDLLFLEPETACVNTNLTLEIQIPVEGVYYSAATSYLVDQGGFVNINKTNPFLDAWNDDAQGSPMLEDRAYQAAWLMNVLSMYFLNVTKPGTNRSAYMNSEVGRRFPMNNSYGYQNMNQLTTATNYMLVSVPLATDYMNGTMTTSNYSSSPIYSNPFNITTLNFTDIQEYCQRLGPTSRPNLTNIGVQCGLVLGVSQRLDNVSTMIVDSGSWWTRPIYSCASVTKASIKTVRFRFNATSSPTLKDLKVINVTNKAYQNQSAMPLWGIETPNMKLIDLDPLWGLIDPAMERSVNLSTIRAGRLYLPASAVSLFPSGLSTEITGYEFMPASTVPLSTWYSTYSNDGYTYKDYTGLNSYQLYSKWRDLSRNASGAAEILNLIWTDYSANALVGTRSWSTGDELPPNLQKRQSSSSTTGQQSSQVPVYLYQRSIRYRWAFGIPAALCLIMVGMICLIASISLLSGRGTPDRVRHYMWNLSPGRVLTASKYPGQSVITSDTKTWIREVGHKSIEISEGSEDTLSGQKLGGSHSYQKVHQRDTKEEVLETTVETQ